MTADELERRRAAARAMHARGRAHRWTSDEARAAGRLGGLAVVGAIGEQGMAALGRAGGRATQEQRRRGGAGGVTEGGCSAAAE